MPRQRMSEEILPQQKLLNVKQVAALLNISEREVWRLRSAGTLLAVSIGARTTRWKRNVVDRYVDALS